MAGPPSPDRAGICWLDDADMPDIGPRSGPAVPPSMVAKVPRIVLLGGFGVAVGGGPLESVGTPRLQSLLAYLLLHRQAPPTRQHQRRACWRLR